ncbi:MAG: hypothetical protein ABSE25_00600 [Syntrophorhabdales bacterium]|jgi:hypothetical protein
MEKTCPHCGKRFLPHPAVLNQQYCGSADCQRARKRKWQKEKLKSDPDYRENQAAAQKAWRERNRGYWREYRKKNKTYSERNRLRQSERNRQRRVIAKMDELGAKSLVSPGRYRLVPLYGKIAKMDELIVEIGVVAGECAVG